MIATPEDVGSRWETQADLPRRKTSALPTLYRWVRSDAGREAALHPNRFGRYIGSGRAHAVLAEAGPDGAGQLTAVKQYLGTRVRSRA